MDIFLNDAGAFLRPGAICNNVFYLKEILSYLDSLSPVCVLARLYNPNVGGGLFAVTFVVSLEFRKFRIIEAFLDVKSHRERIEGIFADCFVVVLHIDPKSLFVCKMVVILNLVVKSVGVHFKFDERLRILCLFLKVSHRLSRGN